VYLKEIKTYNFRNLIDQSIEFSSGVNVIVGKNGQGKTNILEAINILSTVKSFRSSRIAETIGWNKSEASVFGSVVDKNGSTKNLGIAIEKRNKTVFLNDSQIRSADEYIGNLICITFTPDDLELVKGGPGERRKFLDRALSFLDPKYIRTISAYNTALRSKNTILRESYSIPKGVVFDQLDSWNRILAKHGSEILSKRKNFASTLTSRSKKLYWSFAPETEELELSLKSARNNIEPSEFLLFEELTEAREREHAQGQSIVGPHRDDLVISLSGNDSRAFASQGQTRSIVLSLKLALIEEIESRLGTAPVILLDDVDSELDQGRREAFFTAILEYGRQVVITTTDAKEIPVSNNRISEFKMNSGSLIKHS